MENKDEFRLDRTAFRAVTFEEAEQTQAYWLTKTPAERFRAAMYLNSIAYNFDINNPPKMDKTVFSTRKHEK
jgi:hypothetical protein